MKINAAATVAASAVKKSFDDNDTAGLTATVKSSSTNADKVSFTSSSAQSVFGSSVAMLLVVAMLA